MAEYVIVDTAAPDTTLGRVTVDDESGAALVHELSGVEGAFQFDTLDGARAALAFFRPTFEIRSA